MISPGLRIGRYEVGRRLGKGGFGVVHVARDVELDREIAIKVLKPEYVKRTSIVQRFIKEARAAAKIGHAGIVTVFECGQIQGTGTHADGNAYIAMELLVGESLADRMLNGGRMSIAQTLAITRQLAAALAAAHTAGIVHRDLKPDNVFLVPDPAVHGGQRVKVLDFGVAKLMEPSEDGVDTNSQMMLGTPRYMAPEQARSAAKIDHRADIYALGCMVFEMLAGRAPYSGDVGDQIIAHQKAAVPSPREINAAVPPALDALVQRMLAKAPEDRPQAMQDIVDVLVDLGDEPDTVVRAPLSIQRTSAEVTTVAEPVTQRASRRRFAVVGIGAALLSMLVVFLVMRRGRHDAPVPPPPAPKPVPVVVSVDAPPAEVVVVVTVDAAIDDSVRVKCLAARDAKKWTDLITCGEELRAVDEGAGDSFYAIGHAEMLAEKTLRDLVHAANDGDAEKARALLDTIPVDSVYRADAVRRVAQLPAPEPPRANPRAPSPPEAKAACDAGDLLQKGTEALTTQNPARATTLFEAAYRCRPTLDAMKRVFLMACKNKNIARARTLYQKADANTRNAMLSMCANNGVPTSTFEP